jgi:3',5'-cyclic AMP phosphodiesterase CpdA
MDAQREPVAPGAGGGSQLGAPSPAARSKVRFVVLGDYGRSGPAEQAVAELVDAVQPDFVITTGDNNYPSGSAATIDENIGQYFSELIYPYRGSYASSATENRFFPTLGNHDWVTAGAQPYLDYFTLPGNERYYDIVRGDVHFFAIDSDAHEPDGIRADSVQAQWLRQGLASSRAAFQVVAMHHPPYSSCSHGNSEALQWPYGEWGADVVFAGHDHCYERLEVAGTTYVVSGLGGASIYSFGLPIEGSLTRFNDQYGVTVFDADARELSMAFFTIDGLVIDPTKIQAR